MAHREVMSKNAQIQIHEFISKTSKLHVMEGNSIQFSSITGTLPVKNLFLLQKNIYGIAEA